MMTNQEIKQKKTFSEIWKTIVKALKAFKQNFISPIASRYFSDVKESILENINLKMS